MTRLLHASGVPLDALGVGRGPLPEDESRQVWRTVCAHWHVFRGTPVRYWLEAEIAEVFGVEQRPTAENADALYDQIAACLTRATHRPRALFERFGIEVLATTDDPCDDLSAHARLAADPTFAGRVLPAFRRSGGVLAAVLREVAAAVDADLPSWLDGQVGVVTTVVDRITPRPTGPDRQAVLAATGVDNLSRW